MESIHRVISELSNYFSRIVTTGKGIEDRIDLLIKSGGRERLIRALETGSLNLTKLEGQLVDFRSHVSDLYEAAASSRYILIPLLYALPEGDEAIKNLRKDFHSIMIAHNRIAGGYVALLSTLNPLWEAVEAIDAETRESDGMVQQFYNDHESAIDSIAFDIDYLDFMMPFVPEGQDETYARLLNEPGLFEGSEEDANRLCKKVLGRFTAVLLSAPEQMKASVLMAMSVELQRTRIECKEALVELSAIVGRILSRDNSKQSVSDIFELFKSKEFFAVEEEVR